MFLVYSSMWNDYDFYKLILEIEKLWKVLSEIKWELVLVDSVHNSIHLKEDILGSMINIKYSKITCI